MTGLDGEHATIRVDESGCGRCAEPGGCAGRNLGRLLCRTPRDFRVLNPERCVVGQRVRVSVGEGSVLRGAGWAYGLPLLALLAGSLLGSAAGGEPGAIAGAATGLTGGWLALRQVQRRTHDDPRWQPSIRP
ncbi:SoxR reducing system RseC family protein [Accumulibacter sp.]|uniref:SoxR reducing system RseC family protein n=1 Tax=Accumulibacter sp. TaxID=2053492 RepID=UPI0025DB77EE|nr:SoxR reducing system RseC family protein [Accumulibacter sp.]MCM8594445.1 SoxR reducing system RseC family protein [Accumulibacter sp.]MCM8624919.1 SoxR reducing system RseC family protein [Accumulibacter sp.]MDS4048591.1 SoxR reducing system RseC family protein [Accumulibacter sp.]